ncbi:hypothetical protein GLYMA_08G317475v4 [Glycine max]|nr:hypothetical protein GLYMA_08G317475v4 [Glycine max]KAH1054095.1 hypothetical protein GYH30_023052 [Glycine max]
MPSTLTLNLLCGLIISIGQGKGFDVDLIKLISDAISNKTISLAMPVHATCSMIEH